MKNKLLCIGFIALGLVGGYIAGWLMTKNKMKVEVHDLVVKELTEMSNDLQNAAANFYAGRAYNAYGDYFESGYFRETADPTIYFVATFLSNYSDYRQRKGKLFTVEEEKEIRNGKAVPRPSNMEYFLQLIKIDSQHIAKEYAKKYAR